MNNVDKWFKIRMEIWSICIIGFIILTLSMQAVENSKLRSEREYLRARLFVTMQINKESEKVIQIQKHIHSLYEMEISGLRQQTEMLRVDRYISKINTVLTTENRWRIVQAVYHCSSKSELDPLFTLAVMEQESRFDIHARSEKDARGLMQLLVSTAKDLGVKEKNIYNIEQNICGGARYLARHLVRYQGEQTAALQRYYGGGSPLEYSKPVLVRYEKIKRKVRR